jgi:putative zinc finger/helix-turn-helix YgiT family protein
MCPSCGEIAVQPDFIHHVANVKYDGKSYKVDIPELKIGKCQCGEVVFDIETDEQIDTAFRNVALLLTANQISIGRKRLRLKQVELAKALGVAKTTISRWENRALVQSRAMDKALRAYFHSSHVRSLMDRINYDSSIGVDDPPDEDNASTTTILASVRSSQSDDIEVSLPTNRLAGVFAYLDENHVLQAYANTVKQRGAFFVSSN